MSIIKEFKEQNPTSNNEENYGNLINIAVQVESIEDDKYIIGTRVDNNERVKVYLRDIKKQENSKYQRPDVKKLFSKVKNGILKFELCYIDQDGFYSSRWGKVLSKNDGVNNVSIAWASLYYGKIQNSEEEYVQVAVTYLSHKVRVNNLNEAMIVMEKYLQPKTKGSKPFIFIKISDGSETEILRLYGKNKKNENNIKETLSGKETVNDFIQSDRSKILKELIANEQISVDIVPARIIYPGSSYKEILLKKGFNRDMLSSAFIKNKDDENQKQTLGFVSCIITTRNHDDGTPFIVDITTINGDEPITPDEF